MKRKSCFTIVATLLLCFMVQANVSSAWFTPYVYFTTTSDGCDQFHSIKAILAGATASSYSWTISGDAAIISSPYSYQVEVVTDQGFDVNTSYTVCVDIYATNGQTYSGCYTKAIPSYLACGGTP
jgi:hypothetical protein